jgi:hypothetical protein
VVTTDTCRLLQVGYASVETEVVGLHQSDWQLVLEEITLLAVPFNILVQGNAWELIDSIQPLDARLLY